MLDASQIANISSAVDEADTGLAQFQETMLLEDPNDQVILSISRWKVRDSDRVVDHTVSIG